MRRQVGTLLLGVLLVWPAQADWPQFRGPEGTGVAHLPDLPWRWSRQDNVRWCASLPGRGVSSPALAAGALFLRSDQHLFCIGGKAP
jgi:outer membrane protein assembly factor BamB